MGVNQLSSNLADDLAAWIAQRERATFMEVARFLESRGVPWRGPLNLEMNEHPNVLLWSGMSEPMCRLIMRLLDERRLYVHRSSVAAYHVHGGVLELPLADAPKPGGLREPHWLPVVLRPVPPTWAMH